MEVALRRTMRGMRGKWTAPRAVIVVVGLVAVCWTPAAATSCVTSTFAASGDPKAIPAPGIAVSALDVPLGDPVAAVIVHVTLSHSFDSDLKIELVAPNGDVVTLADANGTWGSDYTETTFDDQAQASIISGAAPFSGVFRPIEPLASLAGSSRQGAWGLRITNLHAGYVGELRFWRLDLSSCGASPPPVGPRIGAAEPPALPTGVPAGHIPVTGTLITVTTNADALNGDVSSVARLKARPGPDGISLREAIEATNRDPGSYTIRFASGLARTTILIGRGDLPSLTGGGVTIDGDIDGDGLPDVTIAKANGDPCLCDWGLNVASGGDRVHSLAFRGFSNGVLFTSWPRASSSAALPTHRTFAGDIVSGVIFTDVRSAGILLDPLDGGRDECVDHGCETFDTWNDLRVIGNTITSTWHGIQAVLSSTKGDVLQRAALLNNKIAVSGTRPHFGVNLSAGAGGGADENRITEATVAYNAIETEGSAVGVNIFSGLIGGANNVVQDVAIRSNRIQSSMPSRTTGIHISMSDGCTGQNGQGVCSKGNTARHIQIAGNGLQGQDEGVVATYPCCGPGSNGVLTDVRITDNYIRGVIQPEHTNPWGIEIGTGGSNVSDVVIAGNTIEQQTLSPDQPHAAYLAAGGVAIVGGMGKADGSIKNVLVAGNRIDTDLVGITIVGGGPDPYGDVANDASDNHVESVTLRGNVVVRAPALAARWYPAVKGINVVGGLGAQPNGRVLNVHRNSVTNINLDGNVVAGVANDLSVNANFGEAGVGGTGVADNAVESVSRTERAQPSPTAGGVMHELPSPTAGPAPDSAKLPVVPLATAAVVSALAILWLARRRSGSRGDTTHMNDRSLRRKS